MQLTLTTRETELLKAVAEAAAKIGVPAFAVGGFVRDKILNRPTKDIDIVCIGDGMALAQAFSKLFHPTPPVALFKTFGTAQVKFDDIEIEFVGARKESYARHSRKPEVSPGSIEDLQNKILKTPLAPAQTFDDDPLRMMRAIRFATQLDFTITEETFKGIQQIADRIKIVSQERITDELQKIMLTNQPSKGWYLLKEAGLLQHIFPLLLQLEGAETLDGIGHKDNFSHTLQVLDNVAANSNDVWLRWAALLHDIAKPKTKRFEPGFGWTFHGHEVVGARMVPKIFTQLKLPLNEKMKMVQKLVALHLRPISLTKEHVTDSAIRRLLFDAGDDIEYLMLLCAADITSKNQNKVKRYLQGFEFVKVRLQEVEEKDSIRNWQPPITGEMIMQIFNIAPSKQVGIIKDAIREAILDGVIPNDHDAAYDYMLKEAAKQGLFPVIK